MIPILIMLGLLAGHWWRTALVVGTAAWVVLLLVTGIIGPEQVPVAALLALANTALGVALHQGAAQIVRKTNPR